MMAVNKRRHDIVELLLRAGADLHVQDKVSMNTMNAAGLIGDICV